MSLGVMLTASATLLSNVIFVSNVVSPFPVGKPLILKKAIALSALAPIVVDAGSNLKFIAGTPLPLLNVKFGSVLLSALIPNKTGDEFNIPVISVPTRPRVKVPVPTAIPLTRILNETAFAKFSIGFVVI